MAATLANGGTNPVTGHDCLPRHRVRDVLSVMYTCGMYDFAGQWAYEIGVGGTPPSVSQVHAAHDRTYEQDERQHGRGGSRRTVRREHPEDIRSVDQRDVAAAAKSRPTARLRVPVAGGRQVPVGAAEKPLLAPSEERSWPRTSSSPWTPSSKRSTRSRSRWGMVWPTPPVRRPSSSRCLRTTRLMTPQPRAGQPARRRAGHAAGARWRRGP
jgi:hypothetical protein